MTIQLITAFVLAFLIASAVRLWMSLASCARAL